MHVCLSFVCRSFSLCALFDRILCLPRSSFPVARFLGLSPGLVCSEPVTQFTLFSSLQSQDHVLLLWID